jgi:hypothetical protein
MFTIHRLCLLLPEDRNIKDRNIKDRNIKDRNIEDRNMDRGLQKIIESKYYVAFTMIVILANAGLLASYQRTDVPSDWESTLDLLEYPFNIFFIFECLLTIVAYGKDYLKSGWRRLDLLITLFCTVSFLPGSDNFSSLRLIYLFKYLHLVPGLSGVKTILKAFQNAVVVLRDIALLAVAFFITFGLVGVTFFAGKYRMRCLDDHGNIVTDDITQTCTTLNNGFGFKCPPGSSCKDSGINQAYGTVSFDNILSSMLTVFQTLSTEGWSNNMFWMMDAMNPFVILFFILCVIVGFQIIVQLLVGVIASNLTQVAEDSDKQRQARLLEEFKKNAVKSDDSIPGGQKDSALASVKASRNIFKRFIVHKYFQNGFLFITILNAISLAMVYDEMSPSYEYVLEVANDAFTIIFFVEAVLKILGNGIKVYFTNPFDIFDFVITVYGLIDDFILPGSNSGITAFRARRAFNILRIAKHSTALRRIFGVISRSAELLRGLLVLWILTTVIFAQLGVQLFSNRMQFDPTDPYLGVPRSNFETFGFSILSIFQLYSLENWNDIEVSVARSRGLSATLFPVTVIIIGTFMLSQTLLAIIITAFREDIRITNMHIREQKMLAKLKKRQDSMKRANDKSLFGVFKQLREKDNVRATANIEEVDETLSEVEKNLETYTNTTHAATSDAPVVNPTTHHRSSNSFDVSRNRYGSGRLSVDTNASRGRASTRTSIPDHIFASIDKLNNSVLHLNTNNPFSAFCKELLQKKVFQYLYWALNVISIVVLPFWPQTPVNDSNRSILSIIEWIISGGFLMEFVIRFSCTGFHYFASVKTWPDFISLVTTIYSCFDSSVYWIKVFRLFRLTRVLERFKGVRLVATSILQSLPALASALLPFGLFIFIFAIIGLSLFSGQSYQCNDASVLSRDSCVGAFNNSGVMTPRRWYKYRVAYDNIFDSVQSIIVVSFQEGWPNDAYRYIDANGKHMQPLRNAHPESAIFYVLAEFIGNWFFLSLIMGVIYDHFVQQQEESTGYKYLSEEQKQWVENLEAILHSQPKKKPIKTSSKFRRSVQAFVLGDIFRNIMVCIVFLNIISMLFYYYGASQEYLNVLYWIDLSCFFVYIVEVLITIYGLGPACYIDSNWNKLVLIITMLCGIDYATSITGRSTFFVVFRLLKLFRILNFAKGLQAFSNAMILSFVKLVNIFILMFTTCVVYAIIGMFLFGNVNLENAANMGRHINFQSFSTALLSVYVLSTGENWPAVMDDLKMAPPFCSYELNNCGTVFSPLYFLLLQCSMNWLFVNSFIAVVGDSFDSALDNVEGDLAHREALLEIFNQEWQKYDVIGNGTIKFSELLLLYDNLDKRFTINGKRLLPEITMLFRDVKVCDHQVQYVDVLRSVFIQAIGVLLFDERDNEQVEHYSDELVHNFLSRHPRVRRMTQRKATAIHSFVESYYATKLQKVFRGYKERRQLRKEEEAKRLKSPPVKSRNFLSPINNMKE